MTNEKKSGPAGTRRDGPQATFSLVDGGALVEAVYDPRTRQTRFCVSDGDAFRFEGSVVRDGVTHVPYSPRNNLLQHGVVLLPSEPQEYGCEMQLLAELQAYIHSYVDLTPTFERIAAYYVLLTWLYDDFNELPYLRVRGEPGSGKTRFLQVVGSIVYKPIFACGASTVSPIFRIIDIVRGTLILDESDFRFSDERAEVVKILNNGNARGFPVLRSDLVTRREYDPRAYTVFGPKIVATRGFFDDRALESRFVTEDMGRARMRDGIPITLPSAMEGEALALRNKLLMFRFQNHGKRAVRPFAEVTVEPRLLQVFGPLFAMIDEENAAQSVADLMAQLHRQHIADRGMDTEANLLEVIRDLLDCGEHLSVKGIAEAFANRFGEQYEHKVTAKWIGWLIRRKLLLKTHKSNGVFVIPPEEMPALKRLFERYGIAAIGEPAESLLRDVSLNELPLTHGEVPELPDVAASELSTDDRAAT